MTSKSEITLEHFYIFNGTYAKKEGEASIWWYVKDIAYIVKYSLNIYLLQEEKKILYYYPEKDLDVQIKNIGLSEAIIKFTEYVSQLCKTRVFVYKKTLRRFYEQEFFFYQGKCIAGLLILDNHVIIVIHIKHVRYIINQSLIFGW